jgi:uncharacterized protein YifE (UPF0438 family)
MALYLDQIRGCLMKQKREYWLSREFSDDSFFPYGIARSGDFTIRQSEILETRGELISALIRGKVLDLNIKDRGLKKSILENDSEQGEVAATWLKYLRLKSKSQTVQSLHTCQQVANDDFEDEFLNDDL